MKHRLKEQQPSFHTSELASTLLVERAYPAATTAALSVAVLNACEHWLYSTDQSWQLKLDVGELLGLLHNVKHNLGRD